MIIHPAGQKASSSSDTIASDDTPRCVMTFPSGHDGVDGASLDDVPGGLFGSGSRTEQLILDPETGLRQPLPPCPPADPPADPSSSSSSHHHRPASPAKPRPAVQPTTVPRDPLEPHYFRLPAPAYHARHDPKVAAGVAEDDAAAARDVEFVGPFVARSEDSARRVRRQVVEARKRGVRAQDAVEDALRSEEGIVPWQEHQGRADVELQFGGLVERQTEAEEECFTGNQNLSCYPTNTTTVAQGTWSKFIWNKNYPSFTNNGGYVDIYLFHQDTDQLYTSWTSISNDQGRLSFSPGDAWWANRTTANNIATGQNISWPFYFAITSSGAGLSSGTTRLATWEAIQTALPSSISASRASASALSASVSSASAASVSAAAASSASAASASSANASIYSLTATLTGAALSSASASLASSSDSVASASIAASLSSALESSLRIEGYTGTQTAKGTVTATLPDGHTVTAEATAQANGGALSGGDDDGGNTTIPHYAIVLIAVLGFLALLAAIIGAYFVMRKLRRRRYGVAPGSHGSRSPMMREVNAGTASGGAASSISNGTLGAGAGAAGAEEAGSGAAAGGTGAGAAGLAVGGAAGAAAAAAGAGRRSRSREYSEESDAGGDHENETSPFTSDEASRMADAFRAALRKPGFASGTSGLFGAAGGSGGSGSGSGSGSASGDGSGQTPGEGDGSAGPSEALLRDELASEGKEVRSVGDRRKLSLHVDE